MSPQTALLILGLMIGVPNGLLLGCMIGLICNNRVPLLLAMISSAVGGASLGHLIACAISHVVMR